MSTLAKRLQGLRNFQSRDFWAMIFARPLTILFLLPIADKPWVTPDRITGAAFIVKLVGLGYLAFDMSFSGGLIGALLMNLGLILDNMDGTLARYRKGGSYYGYYIDKALDFFGTALLFCAIAWRGVRQGGSLPEFLYWLMPTLGFAGAATGAYCKWVAEKVILEINLVKALRKGEIEKYVRAKTTPSYGEAPPKRSALDWIKWLGFAFYSIILMNEVDMYFFLLLAMLLEWPAFFGVGVGGVFALGLIVGPALFFAKVRRAERELAATSSP